MSAGFSTDGIILVSVFAFLYIIVLLLRRFQERVRTRREQIASHSTSVIHPDIFILSDNPIGRWELAKIDDNPKHSYENLAPPTYDEVDSPRVSGSYEPPPGYALV